MTRVSRVLDATTWALDSNRYFRSLWSEVRAIYTREHPAFRRTESPFRQALTRSVPETPGSVAASASAESGLATNEALGPGRDREPGTRSARQRRKVDNELRRRERALEAAVRGRWQQVVLTSQQVLALTAHLPLSPAPVLVEQRLGDPQLVPPKSFDDAQTIADAFKRGRPVAIDLNGVDKDLARRIIDFASGLCYALGGTMERLDVGLYLLTPGHIEVPSAEDEASVVARVNEGLEGVLWAPVPQRGSEGELWRRAKPPTATR
jgi:FtsZ-interacting cell division protein YlmF